MSDKLSPALAMALRTLAGAGPDEDVEELHDGPYGYGATYEVDGQEWAVLTAAEADDAWDEALDSYLDDCLLPELPEVARYYFNRETWKRDARLDGRAHAISHYDGEEHEIEVDGQTFYAYRVN